MPLLHLGRVGLPPLQAGKSVLMQGYFRYDTYHGDSSPKLLLDQWGASSTLNQLLRRL